MKSVRVVHILLLCWVIGATASSLAQRSEAGSASANWKDHEARGTSELMAGKPTAAMAEYRIAIQLAPRQPGLHEELGDAIWATSRMDDAQPAYEAELALDPHCSSSLFKLGSLQVIRAEPEKGVILLRRALAIDPTNMEARYYLGRGEGATGQTRAAFEDLQTVTMQSADDSVLAMAWYQLGMLYRRSGNSIAATDAIRKFQDIQKPKAETVAPKTMEPADRKRQLPHPPPAPM